MNYLKLNGLKILIGIWIAFSIGYIIFDLYSKFQDKLVKSAYYAGQEDTVIAMITNLEKDCKSLTLFDKKNNKQIDVANVECFKNKSADANTASGTGTALKSNK